MKTVMREKQWAKKYPDPGTAPLPTAPYVAEEYFALERDRVFRRAWINVGRTDEVPGAGDYFVRSAGMTALGLSVIPAKPVLAKAGSGNPQAVFRTHRAPKSNSMRSVKSPCVVDAGLLRHVVSYTFTVRLISLDASCPAPHHPPEKENIHVVDG